jgi:hypothetical protein
MAGGQQGNIKDPEHDGRLKENREAGRTKGTTPGSRERQDSGGQSSSESRQASGGESKQASGGRGEQGGGGQERGRGERQGSEGDSNDLKSREYRDEKGEVHHHTRTYQEQHRNEK